VDFSMAQCVSGKEKEPEKKNTVHMAECRLQEVIQKAGKCSAFNLKVNYPNSG
jgi:hypothetical protein